MIFTLLVLIFSCFLTILLVLSFFSKFSLQFRYSIWDVLVVDVSFCTHFWLSISFIKTNFELFLNKENQVNLSNFLSVFVSFLSFFCLFHPILMVLGVLCLDQFLFKMNCIVVFILKSDLK